MTRQIYKLKENSDKEHTCLKDFFYFIFYMLSLFWWLAVSYTVFRFANRLHMDLDLQSLFGLHVHSCTHWMKPLAPHPFPRIWAHIRGR